GSAPTKAPPAPTVSAATELNRETVAGPSPDILLVGNALRGVPRTWGGHSIAIPRNATEGVPYRIAVSYSSHDNGPTAPLPGHCSRSGPGPSCSHAGDGARALVRSGLVASGPRAEHALSPPRPCASGSDWKRATAAGRTIARLLSAGRDPRPPGDQGRVGGRRLVRGAAKRSLQRRAADRAGLSSAR